MPKTIDMFRSILLKVQTLLGLTSSFKDGKVKIVQHQDYTIFLTHARKFSKDAPLSYQWKVSSILTRDEEGNPLYIFCQGDLFCDNWTYFAKSIPFHKFLESSLPQLKAKLLKNIPQNDHYLIDKFYNLHAPCAEAAFALKEFIAFDYVLEFIDEGKVKELFEKLSYKDKEKNTVYYNMSKEEYIRSYLSQFITKWEDPYLIPRTMKIELGRNASLYGALLNENSSTIANTLGDVLRAVKKEGFEESEYQDVFKYLSDQKCLFEEISVDDEIWAGYSLPDKKKPEGMNSSILEAVLLWAKSLSITAESEMVENEYLNTAILNGEIPADFILQVTADHIAEVLAKKFVSRKGKLGAVCRELFSTY